MSIVLRWVREDREGFAERYKRVSEAGAWSIADELLEIADATPKEATGVAGTGGEAGSKAQAASLRVDSRK